MNNVSMLDQSLYVFRHDPINQPNSINVDSNREHRIVHNIRLAKTLDQDYANPIHRNTK